MAANLMSQFQTLRESRVWKSIFRRGPANSNRTRSLAVFGNLFLHWMPVKVREKSLRVRASYYLGSISFLLFVILFVTGILLMLYYHPSVPQAYADLAYLDPPYNQHPYGSNYFMLVRLRDGREHRRLCEVALTDDGHAQSRCGHGPNPSNRRSRRARRLQQRPP